MGCHPCVSSLLWGLVVVGVLSAGVVLGVDPPFWPRCDDPRHEALAYQHQLSQQQHEEPAKSIVPSELFRALHGESCAAIPKGTEPLFDARFIVVEGAVAKYIQKKEEHNGLQEVVRAPKATSSQPEALKGLVTNTLVSLFNGAGLALRRIPSLMDGTGAVVVATDWCQFVITRELRGESRELPEFRKQSFSVLRDDRTERAEFEKTLLDGLNGASILLKTVNEEHTMYATARLLKEKHSDEVVSGAKLVTGGKAYRMDKLSYSIIQALFRSGYYANFKMMIFKTLVKTQSKDYRLGDSIIFKFPPLDENPAETAVAQAYEAMKDAERKRSELNQEVKEEFLKWHNSRFSQRGEHMALRSKSTQPKDAERNRRESIRKLFHEWLQLRNKPQGEQTPIGRTPLKHAKAIKRAEHPKAKDEQPSTSKRIRKSSPVGRDKEFSGRGTPRRSNGEAPRDAPPSIASRSPSPSCRTRPRIVGRDRESSIAVAVAVDCLRHRVGRDRESSSAVAVDCLRHRVGRDRESSVKNTQLLNKN